MADAASKARPVGRFLLAAFVGIATLLAAALAVLYHAVRVPRLLDDVFVTGVTLLVAAYPFLFVLYVALFVPRARKEGLAVQRLGLAVAVALITALPLMLFFAWWLLVVFSTGGD